MPKPSKTLVSTRFQLYNRLNRLEFVASWLSRCHHDIPDRVLDATPRRIPFPRPTLLHRVHPRAGQRWGQGDRIDTMFTNSHGLKNKNKLLPNEAKIPPLKVTTPHVMTKRKIVSVQESPFCSKFLDSPSESPATRSLFWIHVTGRIRSDCYRWKFLGVHRDREAGIGIVVASASIHHTCNIWSS